MMLTRAAHLCWQLEGRQLVLGLLWRHSMPAAQEAQSAPGHGGWYPGSPLLVLVPLLLVHEGRWPTGYQMHLRGVRGVAETAHMQAGPAVRPNHCATKLV